MGVQGAVVAGGCYTDAGTFVRTEEFDYRELSKASASILRYGTNKAVNEKEEDLRDYSQTYRL